MTAGRVLFVGCGPGAADLLTLRAARALAQADVVIWSASLLDEDALREHVRPDAEIVAWPPATQRDVIAVLDRARTEDLLVVRLKGGDPTLFGALEPDMSAARERGLAVEIVPGVSALGAAAATLGVELVPAGASLLLIDGAATSTEDGTVAAFMAGRDAAAFAGRLLRRGLAPDTPCAVAVNVSRPSELAVSCSLDELRETIEDYALGTLSIVLAGPPLGAVTGR